MNGVKRYPLIITACFSLIVCISLLGCAESALVANNSLYRISFEDYPSEMLEDAIETLPEFIDANSSVIDVYGSVNQEAKQIHMSMVVSTDNESQAVTDANALIDILPERANSVAYLHASDEGDSTKAEAFQALSSNLDDMSTYSIYQDYRLIVHVSNEDGVIDLFGIRESGRDELVLWQ